MRRSTRTGVGVRQPTGGAVLHRAWLVWLVSITIACGSPADSYLNDTWTWDGTDWQKAGSAQGPSWRFGALYVYDEATGEIVLFGGQDAAAKLLSDTWTWNGHWTRRHPAVSPPARRWPAAAYDPVHSNVVMFGGNSGGSGHAGDFRDTWTWDGQTWSEIGAPLRPSPPAQSFALAPAAFDPASRQVVLVNSPTCFESVQSCTPDTWSWGGEGWTLHPSRAPVSPQTPTGFLYTDSKRGRLVMLNGEFGTLDGRSWVWNGADWSAVSTPPFQSITVAGFAFDIDADALVSFGGNRCPTANTSDTMVFDGSTWSEQLPATRPPARNETYLAYDSNLHKIVMFGGLVRAQCSGSGVLP